MRNQTKRMATCAMMTALCVVLMWLGAILELGMYVAPLFAGLCLIPIGQKYGSKYQLTVGVASSLLSLMLVPNIEQNLLYVGLFGWYPVLRPKLQKLPKVLSFLAKLLIFNVVVIAIEALVICLLVPEALTAWMIVLLLVLANITFLAYDFLIPRMEILMSRITKLI